MPAGTLIIGASQAGLQLAVSLRDAGETDPITLVGAEPYAPYQRPPLSKAYLHGNTELEQLWLRAPEVLAGQDITLITGERVEKVDLYAGGPPGTARTASGRVLDFDRLALTVGARPRQLTVPGANLDGVTYLRTADDATVLRALQSDAESVVVIGGGFIGLEAAAVARTQGKAVTVVEAADRLIGRAVAPVVSEFYRGAHIGRGVDVRLGTKVISLGGKRNRVQVVTLADGSQIPADLVIVGIGVEPCTELARQLGLASAGGIVVDRFARTSNPTVVAAGDCTVQPHPLTGEGRVRLESVQNAISQAKTAAATLMGQRVPNEAVPWFWSDQYDLKLQIAGLSAGHDEYVVRGDIAAESFSVLYYRDDALLAVDAVNMPGDYMAVRKALSLGATIHAGAAADSKVALRDLIVPQAIGA
ncbi:ferredoxin [Mycobacterium sp. ACS1612]|uniref:NAD(P)/FAD-dependent oxidoreductase n=1 Tax=Mycobacterium sp. ACS1612 TaxID=1834117 RepID=UPI0007FB7B52|nr:FAD-dependent oxidoreductase [Mycobacterium sp. ACS1612]OBF39467.1 ferredoxin [Mycobacterium sp. ACS1612]